jgi:hypothetical protein
MKTFRTYRKAKNDLADSKDLRNKGVEDFQMNGAND